MAADEAKLPVFELGDVFFEYGPELPQGDCSVREGAMLEPRQVTVHSPEWRKSGLTGYHTYKITSAPSTVNHVYRRYSDFVWLRDLLCKIFPGVFVPPLPPKKILSSKSEQIMLERHEGLQRFLTRCLMLPLLVRSAPFQTFLSRTQTFSEACKELNRNAGLGSGKIGKLMGGGAASAGSGDDAAEIVRQYKELFPEEMGAALPENADQLILDLQQFLQSTETKLKGLVDNCAAMHHHMGGMAADLRKLQEQMTLLHTAEKGYPSLPQPGRLDLQPYFAEWGRTTAELSLPSYRSPLLKLFVYELADVRSFLELLKVRAAVLTRYNKAVRKAERWRNAPPGAEAEEKQRMQKQLDLAREEEERDLLDALTKLLLGSQIRLVWSQKTVAFERAWARFAGEQLKASKNLAACWQNALDVVSDPANQHPSPAQQYAADLEEQARRPVQAAGAGAPQHYRNSDAVLGDDGEDDEDVSPMAAAASASAAVASSPKIHDSGFGGGAYGQEQGFGASDDDLDGDDQPTAAAQQQWGQADEVELDF